jgi:hypothetical protein
MPGPNGIRVDGEVPIRRRASGPAVTKRRDSNRLRVMFAVPRPELTDSASESAIFAVTEVVRQRQIIPIVTRWALYVGSIADAFGHQAISIQLRTE